MKDYKVEFVRHKTAKALVLSWFRVDHPRMKEEKLLKQKTDFTLTIGNEIKESGTVEELIKVVRSIGHWGYCMHVNKEEKEVHYWVGKKTTEYEIMNFLAHEVAHAVGYYSEKSACKIGGICAFAYEVMKSYFSEYIKNETEDSST